MSTRDESASLLSTIHYPLSTLANSVRLYFRYIGVAVRSQMQYRASLVMLALGHFLITGIEILADAIKNSTFANNIKSERKRIDAELVYGWKGIDLP